MKQPNTFALKGNVLHTPQLGRIESKPASYLVCENGEAAGIYAELPQRFSGVPVVDCADKLIIPGLVDLHLHAPQYAFRGLGMDLELLDWLNTYTFPAEAKYANEEYARRAYRQFVDTLVAGGTTRASVFATIHLPATLLLMDMLEQSGLATLVGKVNMDRNSPDILCEADAAASLALTKEWLGAAGRYKNTRPILTPRFIPSCSDALMEGLAALQKESGLPVQSHLSENPSEVAWVRELCPAAGSYADAYHRHGMLGGDECPTIMAHCVYSEGEEEDLLAARGVYVAHCPNSNANLASGIAPVRRFLNRGIKTGLGTDVAGGFSPSIFRAMADAIQHSKLRWRLVDDALPPLTAAEAFFLGTKGGGSFFGKVGSFEEGYAFDALVLEDAAHPSPDTHTPEQRLERMIYLATDADIEQKYVAGRRIK